MNMRFLSLAFASLLFLATAPVRADGLKTPEDMRKLSDHVMALITEGKVEEAFTALKPYWVVSEDDIKALIEASQKQMPEMIERFGKPLSYVFVEEGVVADTVAQYTYLEKFEKYPLTWTLLFYRAKDEWQVNTVKSSASLQHLFK